MRGPIHRLDPDVRVEHPDAQAGLRETQRVLEVLREAGFVPRPQCLEDAPSKEHPGAGEVHEQPEPLLRGLQALEPEPRLVVVESGDRVRVLVHDAGDGLGHADVRVVVEVLRDPQEEVRLVPRVGVEDRDHVSAGVGDGPVQGERLAFREAAGEALHVREGRGEALADRRGRIDGSVLDEEDLEKVFRIL